jgi:hypothetical protein
MRKWECVEENTRRRQVVSNPLLGVISDGDVYVDVYRKKKRNGTYKYKTKKR